MPDDPSFRRGEEDSPLPPGCFVYRGSKLPLNYSPDEGLTRASFNFKLTGADEKEKPPKLSVYETRLTTPEQVCALVADGISYRLVASLSVDDIRKVDPFPQHKTQPPSHATFEGLEVIWSLALDAFGEPETKPGADGHAAILGMQKPKGFDKNLFKNVQDALAELVGNNYTIVNVPGKTVDVDPTESGMEFSRMPDAPVEHDAGPHLADL